jgi:hypothetical protein
MGSEQDECWICLGNSIEEKLISPCKCPSKVHTSCLARWQVSNIGFSEEFNCRFCNGKFPHWKKSFDTYFMRCEPAIFTLNKDGLEYKLSVYSHGYEYFEKIVKDLYNKEVVEISYTFNIPSETTKITILPSKNPQKQFESAVILCSYLTEREYEYYYRNISIISLIKYGIKIIMKIMFRIY